MINDFLTAMEKDEGLKPSTIKSYKYDLLKFQRWYGASKDITKVKRIDIEKFMQFEEKRRLKNRKLLTSNTRNRTLASIKGFYRWLELERIIDKNPAGSIKLGRPRRRTPQTLTRQQIKTLFELLKGAPIRTRIMFKLFYGLGLRLSELAKLELRDIDLKEKVITIRHCGKGDKTRKCPIFGITVGFLQKYISEERSLKEGNPKGWLFPGRKGTHLDVKTIREEVYKYLRSVSGCEKATPLWLRHTFALHMLERGVRLGILHFFLGNSSLLTTFHYERVLKEKTRALKKKTQEVDLRKSFDSHFDLTWKDKVLF